MPAKHEAPRLPEETPFEGPPPTDTPTNSPSKPANASPPFKKAARKPRAAKILPLPENEATPPKQPSNRRTKAKGNSEDVCPASATELTGNTPHVADYELCNAGTLVRKALQTAFEDLGGVDALTRWAEANPKEFYSLYAKLLALQPKTGESGNLVIQWQK